MGWKSTVDIDRSEAIRLITERLVMVHQMSNDELSEVLEGMGYGDTNDLPYFGCNFNVVNEE